jgi:DNA invertase Pin-like site-specific DNA recombinase
MLDYSRNNGVDPRAVLDYVSGFSKINNRERFERDVWEGEKQFDRVYRTSATAVKSRIDYLYPKPPADAALSRYLTEFEKLVTVAREHGVNVVAIKMPVPAQFRSRIPNETAFDEAMIRLAAAQRISLHDFSKALDEVRFYFDTDHLNRAGLTLFFHQELKRLFAGIP